MSRDGEVKGLHFYGIPQKVSPIRRSPLFDSSRDLKRRNKVLNGSFPGTQSFVIGSRVNVQFMVKDSKKYVATGGWGFADFTDGKPGDKALHETCFSCHVPAKDRDYVFTRYAR
jgi:hypothetical protein